MAKLETFSDPFTGTIINTTPWFVTQAGSATVTAASSGAQCNYPASSTSSTDGDISANSTYDLTNSYGYIQILTVPSAGTNADGVFEITQGGGTGNYVRWVYEAGTIYAQWAVAYAPTTVFSVAYNSTTHKYWRIREGTGGGGGGTAGNLYWDTSTDGISWTQRATVATSVVTGGVTALLPLIGGVCYQNETSPGVFKWSNFNVIPSTVNKGAAFLAAINS